MPKIVNHDDRRRDIVKAASRIIGSGGLEKATVREIAKEAGYSSGTLAHYFTNLEDILASCLVMAHRGVRARTDVKVEGMRGLEALRVLLIEALPIDDERLLEAKIEVCFWGAAVGNDLLRSLQNEEVDVFQCRMRRHLAQAQEDGELRTAVDLDVAAEECRMLVDALSVQAVMCVTRIDGEEMLAYVDALLDRLRPAPTGGSDRPEKPGPVSRRRSLSV